MKTLRKRKRGKKEKDILTFKPSMYKPTSWSRDYDQALRKLLKI